MLAAVLDPLPRPQAQDTSSCDHALTLEIAIRTPVHTREVASASHLPIGPQPLLATYRAASPTVPAYFPPAGSSYLSARCRVTYAYRPFSPGQAE